MMPPPMPIQIKWLHGGRLRRFEMKPLTFSGLMGELRKRVPTFGGTICYIDDQNDEIVVENDQDLMDMVGYFDQMGEKVLRIQTNNENGGQMELQKGMGDPDPESAEERGSVGKRVKIGIGAPMANTGSRGGGGGMAAGTSLDTFMEKFEMDGQQSPHSSSQFVAEEPPPSMMGGNNNFPAQFEWLNNSFGRQSVGNSSTQSSTAGGAVFEAMDMASKTKRNTRSNAIPCMECGMMVANAGTSLKCHVNLHHLKLPIYSCRLCGQTSTHLQKAAIVRHIERDHPRKSTEEFDYNYSTYSGQIQQKMMEYFPGRNADANQQNKD